MNPQQKAEWYIKWQSMTNQQRFDSITYTERATQAQEVLNDNVNRHIPFIDFFNRWKDVPGNSYDSLQNEFAQIVQSSRANCQWNGVEWLIPQNFGTQRLDRNRQTQEQSTTRSADINNGEQLASLVAGGQSQLARFAQGVPVIHAANPSNFILPTVHARAHDQVQVAAPQNVLQAAIEREAGLNSIGH